MSLLGERERDAVSELWSGLERTVTLHLELGPEEVPVTVLAGGREIDFGAETRALLEELAGLSDDVTLDVEETAAPGRYPAITIGGRLRYLGLPWGYELSTLVGAVVEAGRLECSLSARAQAALEALAEDISLDVYVTPT